MCIIILWLTGFTNTKYQYSILFYCISANIPTYCDMSASRINK